jgi:Ulp1 family protease
VTREHTPEERKLEWITTDVPRQGRGSNDCGVIASCFALLYVRGSEIGGLLTENAVENVLPVRYVTLAIPQKQNMEWCGVLCRR